jgi:hypothetical protein
VTSGEDLPVVAPVSRPTPAADPAAVRTPRVWVVVALLLSVCVGVASALAFFRGDGPDEPTVVDGPRRPTGKDPRFGADLRPSAERLRDRLVSGLLSLRRPDGTWHPRPGHPLSQEVHVNEATASALAGLCAARWTGSKDPALPEAIRKARETLAARQELDGTFGAPTRAQTRDRLISALSFAILGFALAGDPSDGPVLERAGEALRHQMALGAALDYWTRALSIQAILALVGTGHGASLGPEPRSLIDRKAPPDPPRCRDDHVAEAFARLVREDVADGYPERIAALCAEPGPEWGEERTDLYAWLMRAWVAARTQDGGGDWFRKAVEALEEAPNGRGVIQGDFYGDPVSRTACALLILLEGWTPQHPFGS